MALRDRMMAACLVAALLAAGPAFAGPLVVRGTVTEANGRPAAGGWIWIGGFAGFGPIRNGVFEFEVDSAPAGDHLVVYNNAALLVARQVHIAPRQAVLQVAIQVGEDPVVAGRVVADDMPEGAPGALVEVRRESAAGPPLAAQLFSDSDGRFALEGRALAGANVRALLPYHLPSEWVEVRPPFPMQVELRCQQDTLVYGQVLDTEGNPVAGAQVIAITDRRSTSQNPDEFGCFEFRGLEPGRYRFTAGGRYVRQSGVTLDVQQGRPVLGVTIRLDRLPAQPLSGRAVGPDGDTGIAGAEVRLTDPIRPTRADGTPSQGHGWAVVYAATTGGKLGHFHIDLPVDREVGQGDRIWSVEVKADGYVERRYSVALDPENGALVRFQLFHGGRLRGTVRDAEGKVPKGTRVDVEIAGGYAPPLTKTYTMTVPSADIRPADGFFDFGLVQPGAHRLLVRRGSETLAEQQVTVKEGEETVAEVRLDSGL